MPRLKQNVILPTEKHCNSFPDPYPSSWFQFEDYCYLVKGSRLSWSAAQEYCRYQGGDLVKINNIGENEFVLQLVRQEAPSVKQVWIGLGWHSETEDWTWIDNSHPFFTYWSPGEPNGFEHEPCAEMYVDNTAELPVNGYWNDQACDKTYGIVCKKLADHGA